MEPTDQQLVKRVLGGQTEEFRSLVERHQPAVFRVAWGLLGNREEACDVTQEVFLSAFANLSSYDASRAAMSTWLITFARNRCLNLLARRRPITSIEPDSIGEAPQSDPIVTQEIAEQLDRALAALPVDQRLAFLLAEIEEIPYAEIARIQSISIGTVKSRIHRAKRRLRSLLEPTTKEML